MIFRNNKNKKARFMPFWILLGLLGILLIGSFITPLRIVADDIFLRIESNAIENETPGLSCTNPDAPGWFKATCFTIGGILIIVIYILYQFVTAMINGSQSKVSLLSLRYRRQQQLQAALKG